MIASFRSLCRSFPAQYTRLFFSTQSYAYIFYMTNSVIPTELKKGTMTPESKRTGVVALKIGMMPIWDKWCTRIPCTVLQVESVSVALFVR